jgi:hypothetical protein
MIPHGVEVFVGLDPVDLRWGFERLAGLVAEKVGRDARSGALFVFFGKRRAAIKVLFFDSFAFIAHNQGGRLPPFGSAPASRRFCTASPSPRHTALLSASLSRTRGESDGLGNAQLARRVLRRRGREAWRRADHRIANTRNQLLQYFRFFGVGIARSGAGADRPVLGLRLPERGTAEGGTGLYERLRSTGLSIPRLPPSPGRVERPWPTFCA